MKGQAPLPYSEDKGKGDPFTLRNIRAGLMKELRAGQYASKIKPTALQQWH